MQPGSTASGTTTGGRRRVSVQSTRGVGASASGAGSASVWEARRRMDEVKGGVKVFRAGAGDEPADEEGMRVYRRLHRNQSEGGAGGANAAAKKRRNWKASEPVTAIGELRKSRSDAGAAAAVATSGVVARRAMARLTTPEKKVAPAGGEVKEVVVIEVAKAPLEEAKNMVQQAEELDDDEDELGEELETEEEKQMLDQDHMAIDEDETALHQVDDDQDLEPPAKAGIKPSPSLEEERAANPGPVKPPPEKKLASAIDLRAMNPEPMTPPPVEKKPTPIIVHRMTNAEPAKLFPEKKALPSTGRRIQKQEPVSTPPVEEEYEEIQDKPSAPSRSHARMQNIVDLVMWRDVSKSALVFGLGTFLLISSSYAKDLNFNTITAASYAGLIYLGLRFFSKSILNRSENMDCDDERCYLVGEEEAIWLLRLVLPYINEVLLNLRSLFSGEPGTTMKLALLLFALARCGNFVTLWTLAKLVFFGVFIIPKVCSSYSTQLARYGILQTKQEELNMIWRA
ncbi:reticulon-like protein B21 isoform X2 [Phragmites australis]|uniref:reticulon-like protein B21 isoform X2 n=1 Tax=Phragmites australis TaxID=29695 RepID=UPI002D788AB2|nr:reticulon-like protein B21 isoform X2 [Phragmites australis]